MSDSFLEDTLPSSRAATSEEEAATESMPSVVVSLLTMHFWRLQACPLANQENS